MMGDWRQTSGLVFKRRRQEHNSKGYDRYHSAARSPEKDRGVDSPLGWLPSPSVAFTISVTPMSRASRLSRSVDALGVFTDNPCMHTRVVSQSYSTQRAPEVSA